MRPLPFCLLMAVLAAPAAAEGLLPQQEGRFPVFGPSQEREDFFAAQEAERQAAYERHREELRAAATQEQEVLGETDPHRHRVKRHTHRLSGGTLVCDPPAGTRLPAPRSDAEDPFARKPMFRDAPVASGSKYRRCTTVYPPHRGHVLPHGTTGRIKIGTGGITGSLTYRGPGVSIIIGTD